MYWHRVDLQCLLVPGIQQSESILCVCVCVYKYNLQSFQDSFST